MQVLEINKMAATILLSASYGERGSGYAVPESRQLDDETIKRFALGYSSKYSSNLYQYFKAKNIR